MKELTIKTKQPYKYVVESSFAGLNEEILSVYGGGRLFVVYDKNTKKLLESVPYSRIVVIDKDVQVTQRLKMGDLNLYVDNNEYRRSTINSEYAIPLRDLNKYISRRRYK